MKDDDLEAEDEARAVLAGQTRSYVSAASELALAYLESRRQLAFSVEVEDSLRTRALVLEAALKRLDPAYARGIENRDEAEAV